MKCPACSHDQSRGKDGMRCTKCSYAFVFDPKTGPGLTDGAALALARKASGNFSNAFTLSQLRTAFLTKKGHGFSVGGQIAAVAACIFGFVLAQTLGSIFYLFGGVLVAGAAILFVRKKVTWDEPLFVEFERLWLQLLSKHSSDKTGRFIADDERLLLDEPSPSEADIYEYGAERILIVDDDKLVDLLVTNSFHADQRVLVLSQSGYPKHLQRRANSLLNERSDLPIFLAHGVHEDTVGLPEWLGCEEHPVVDIGLDHADLRSIGVFKWLPENRIENIPLDALPNVVLVSILEHCFLHGQSFSEARATMDAGAMESGAAIAIGDFG